MVLTAPPAKDNTPKEPGILLEMWRRRTGRAKIKLGTIRLAFNYFPSQCAKVKSLDRGSPDSRG